MKKQIIISTLFVFGLTGCNFVEDIIADKIAEKVTEEVAEEVIETAIENESGGKAEVDASSGHVTVKTDKGTVSISGGEEAQLPDNFPKDVALPKNAIVKMAMEQPEGMTVTLQVDDPPNDLAASLAKESETNGWKQKSKMDMGAAKIMIYEKEGRTLNISIASDKKSNAQTVLLGIRNKK